MELFVRCEDGLRKRGFKMKYEEPKIEIIYLELGDVVTLSSETGGSGEDTTGPWA